MEAEACSYLFALCATGAIDVLGNRKHAPRLWARNTAPVEEIMPTYFEDRLAFRIALLRAQRDQREQFPDDILYGAPMFGQKSNAAAPKTHPLIGDHFPAHSPHANYEPHPWTVELLEAWHGWLQDNGIAVPHHHFTPFRYATWADLFTDSIYTPGPAAIDGPGFLDVFSREHQTDIIRKYGPPRIAAFTVAMMLAHERTHRLQRGEPLLAELIVAILWTSFTKRLGLVDLQIDRITGATSTIESQYVDIVRRSLPGGPVTDTADVLSSVAHQSRYATLCALAYLHDGGNLRYLDYLHFAAQVICNSGQDSEMKLDTQLVCRRLRVPAHRNANDSVFELKVAK